MKDDSESRLIVITGATSGLGLAAAEQLARAGHRVVIHGRSAARLDDAAKRVSTSAGAIQADLGDLSQVDLLADRLVALGEPIDVLINNAGLGMTVDGTPARYVSVDGHEMHWAVNYLAMVALTERLLPSMSSDGRGRIINVVSKGQAPIDFDDLTMLQSYDGRLAYQRSKLASTMYTFDLAQRLASMGVPVSVNALHPATRMPTGMAARDGIASESALADGVDAVTWLAVTPDVTELSGRYFEVKSEVRAHDDAYDPAIRARLAEVTAQAVPAYRTLTDS